MQVPSRIVGVVLLATMFAPALLGQGPQLEYLADPATDLPWAQCYVHLDGGSRHKIPFLPVVNSKGAPTGTEKYTKDINVNAYIAFVGNGIVRGDMNAYRGLDVAGKVVMFAYDFPDAAHANLEKQVSKEERIREAITRKATAVVLFSMAEEFPFPYYEETDLARIPEIPIIVINRHAASVILASGGWDPQQVFEKWKSKGTFEPQILISKLELRIEGKFDHIETANFSFYFQKGAIPPAQAAALAEVNEKSMEFILGLFQEAKLAWRKSFSAYFPDYDSKVFYVHHWGSGLSSDAGTFMVFRGPVPDFGLAVHENAHILLDQNWGGTSSFLQEGFGRYAEAMATGKDMNHRVTANFLKEARLFRLSEMVGINIGMDPRTHVAYPAAGSFVQYLVQTYGVSKLKIAWQTPGQDAWATAFGKPLLQLESDWLHWLAAHYDLNTKLVEDYLSESHKAALQNQ